MSSCRRQLERAPGAFLPADVGEVGRRRHAVSVRRQRRLGLELALALVVRRLERHVSPLVERGLVSVPVHATYPLERAGEAYDAFAAGGKFGKIVLTAGG